ncbi:MAG: bifunctional precorrin-2 dehydrogenase/sirohydrochlorin ferrochelatase [archaeon]|nr:bifunctional precorrin-2 dehydrogenase/sirohydrochlorin ferrochelatase [archaeon]
MSDQFIPVFINASNLKIIVFGGGSVALRKCKYFRNSKITIVSKSILPELRRLASEVIIREIPKDVKTMMKAYDMVIAATDSEVINNSIRDDAFSMGIYVNSAHGGGTVLIPSVLKRECYTVAVSSEGRVPGFPPYVVKRLDSFLGEEYDYMLSLMVEIRGRAKKVIKSQRERSEFLRLIMYDEEVQSLIENRCVEKARAVALKKGGFEC